MKEMEVDYLSGCTLCKDGVFLAVQEMVENKEANSTAQAIRLVTENLNDAVGLDDFFTKDKIKGVYYRGQKERKTVHSELLPDAIGQSTKDSGQETPDSDSETTPEAEAIPIGSDAEDVTENDHDQEHAQEGLQESTGNVFADDPPTGTLNLKDHQTLEDEAAEDKSNEPKRDHKMPQKDWDKRVKYHSRACVDEVNEEAALEITKKVDRITEVNEESLRKIRYRKGTLETQS